MEEPENKTNDRAIKIIVFLTLAAIVSLIFFGVIEADRIANDPRVYHIGV